MRFRRCVFVHHPYCYSKSFPNAFSLDSSSNVCVFNDGNGRARTYQSGRQKCSNESASVQPSSRMRFVSCKQECFGFHSSAIVFHTKSCHPYIGSNIASDGIEHLLSIKIMIPHELHLQTISEDRIKNNFGID